MNVLRLPRRSERHRLDRIMVILAEQNKLMITHEHARGARRHVAFRAAVNADKQKPRKIAAFDRFFQVIGRNIILLFPLREDQPVERYHFALIPIPIIFFVRPFCLDDLLQHCLGKKPRDMPPITPKIYSVLRQPFLAEIFVRPMQRLRHGVVTEKYLSALAHMAVVGGQHGVEIQRIAPLVRLFHPYGGDVALGLVALRPRDRLFIGAEVNLMTRWNMRDRQFAVGNDKFPELSRFSDLFNDNFADAARQIDGIRTGGNDRTAVRIAHGIEQGYGDVLRLSPDAPAVQKILLDRAVRNRLQEYVVMRRPKQLIHQAAPRLLFRSFRRSCE